VLAVWSFVFSGADLASSQPQAATASTSVGSSAGTPTRIILFLPGICPNSESYWTQLAQQGAWFLDKCSDPVNAQANARNTFSHVISELDREHARYIPAYFSYNPTNPNQYGPGETHYVGIGATALRR